MKRALMLLLLFAMLLSGCAAEDEMETSQKPEEDKKIQIGMIFDTFVVERWQRDRDVFVSTARELGAEVNVQNANGDVDEQIAQMEYFIEKKVDVIVLVPIESSTLLETIHKAKNAGIKVIAYDRLVVGGGVDMYVSFDNEAVGQLMARAVASKLHVGDRVLMVCGPTSDHNVSLVESGFKQELRHTGIQIADIYYTDEWRAEYAAEYMERYPDLQNVQAIMCGNDNIAGRIIDFLARKRLAGQICVVAQDADLEACQRIVEGTQYMTVYKPVDKLAVEAAQAAVALARGEEVETGDEILDGVYTVPYIKLSPMAVTSSSMDDTIIRSGFHLAEDVYLNRPDLMKNE